jgi:hypothetical protein
MLFYGHHVTGKWWSKSRWEDLEESLPPWLFEELTIIRRPAGVRPIDDRKSAETEQRTD